MVIPNLIRADLEWGDIIQINTTWLEDGRYQLQYKDLTNKDYAIERNKEIVRYQSDPNTKIELKRDKETGELITYCIHNNKNLIYIWVKKEHRRKKIATNFLGELIQETKLLDRTYKFY